jgi:Cellulose biosynthesis protein BcsS
MRAGVALRIALVAAGLAACGAAAQEADDDDAEPGTTSQNASFFASLLDPAITATPSFDFLTRGMPDRMFYFTGIELQRWSLGAYAGAQWAPARIDREGFILRMLASDSIEHFTTPAHRTNSQIMRAAIMPGYKFSRDKADLQLLGGGAAEVDAKSTDGAAAKWRVKVGAQVSADLWWEPTHLLMLQTSISATTIDSGFSARAAVGWRLFHRFWVGPEVTASRDYFSSQYRVGAHLTGLRTDQYEWSIAGGGVWDSYQREGIYARIGIVMRPARPMHLD